MTNRIIASVMAAAVAFTSLGSTPVRAADAGEISRFILGAGALMVIANELSKNSGGHGPSVTRHIEPPRINHFVEKPQYNAHVYKPKPHRRVVPAACLRVNHSGHGPRKYFGQRCLGRNMHNVSRLPGGCTAKIYTRHGPTYVYSAHCLRKHGWVFG